MQSLWAVSSASFQTPCFPISDTAGRLVGIIKSKCSLYCGTQTAFISDFSVYTLQSSITSQLKNTIQLCYTHSSTPCILCNANAKLSVSYWSLIFCLLPNTNHLVLKKFPIEFFYELIILYLVKVETASMGKIAERFSNTVGNILFTHNFSKIHQNDRNLLFFPLRGLCSPFTNLEGRG